MNFLRIVTVFCLFFAGSSYAAEAFTIVKAPEKLIILDKKGGRQEIEFASSMNGMGTFRYENESDQVTENQYTFTTDGVRSLCMLPLLGTLAESAIFEMMNEEKVTKTFTFPASTEENPVQVFGKCPSRDVEMPNTIRITVMNAEAAQTDAIVVTENNAN